MSLDFLLKSFVEEDNPKRPKDEISLTGILQRKRLHLARQKSFREASLSFNPYSLAYGFCMREKVAQLAGYHTILIKPPTPKEQLIFDIGHKYHDIIQGYFWKIGILEGTWRCRECWHKWWAKSPLTCPKCGSKYNIEFGEIPLQDEEYQISGRSDGIICVEYNNQEQQQLLDIKSMSNKGIQDNPHDRRLYFEDLEEQGPPESHEVQLMCYQRMAGIHNGHLLYVSKNGHQMKSFYIKYNEQRLTPYLETIREALEWANDLREGKRNDLPGVCSRKKCECQTIIRLNERIKEKSS